MPLSKFFITILLFSTTFLLPFLCSAQDYNKSRTRAVIPYNHPTLVAPPGMVYVRGGTTKIRYDQSSTDTNSTRKVSLTSFFMDKTEVTNQQYRKFINWVIDSIAIVSYLKDDKYFIERKKKNGDSTKSVVKTGDSTKMPTTDTFDNTRRINWTMVDHGKIFDSKNEDTWSKLQPLIDENGNIKTDAYIFSYTYNKTVNGPTKGSKITVHKTVPVSIYPDENSWSEDLTNSQTEMYVENYFKATPFDDYPVVGVSWIQANAFAYWRSINAEKYYNMPDYMKYYHLIYTLPSEAQWVYAAQGFYDMIIGDPPEDTAIVMDTTVIPQAQVPPAEAVTTDGFTSTSTAVPVVRQVTDSTVTPHPDSYTDSLIQAVKAKQVAQKEKEEAEKLKQQQEEEQQAQAATDQAAQPEEQPRKYKSAADSIRAVRKAQKLADRKFNYYIADYLRADQKYGGKYSGGEYYAKGAASTDSTIGGTRGPIVDSSPVHFDPRGMLSNFKQDEGDYWEDGSALTTPVMSYAPNEFGLYNMEGNVSEWVMDAYSPSTYSFVSDLNPVLLYDADTSDAEVMKRKVIRGGSFMSNAKALSPYYRDMELQNVAHCYLGFRCVMQAPEIIGKNVSTRNKTIRGKHVKGKFSEIRLPEIH